MRWKTEQPDSLDCLCVVLGARQANDRKVTQGRNQGATSQGCQYFWITRKLTCYLLCCETVIVEESQGFPRHFVLFALHVLPSLLVGQTVRDVVGVHQNWYRKQLAENMNFNTAFLTRKRKQHWLNARANECSQTCATLQTTSNKMTHCDECAT